MGKVGDLHDPEDHGETDGDQAVDTTDNKPIEDLLEKERFHTQVSKNQKPEYIIQKSEVRGQN